MNEKNDSIETFIKEADLHLKSMDTTSTFSNQGFQKFKKSVNEYICELLTESIKTSKRYSEKIVYPTHVEKARQKLYFQYKNKFKSVLNTIGGVIFGISATNFYLMSISNSFNSSGVSFSAILLFLGTFLIAYRSQ
ncbi:MAG TPA: hypothetical protein VMZ91_12915 [Candidatus Paceibacterota bacterium]|nr:hypothetical protein [Candidatus Paceibacterota bacterium]